MQKYSTVISGWQFYAMTAVLSHVAEWPKSQMKNWLHSVNQWQGLVCWFVSFDRVGLWTASPHAVTLQPHVIRRRMEIRPTKKYVDVVKGLHYRAGDSNNHGVRSRTKGNTWTWSFLLFFSVFFLKVIPENPQKPNTDSLTCVSH